MKLSMIVISSILILVLVFSVASQTIISPRREGLADADGKIQITSFYAKYLGRAPDPGGLDWWSAEYVDGRKTMVQVEAGIRASSERESYSKTHANRAYIHSGDTTIDPTGAGGLSDNASGTIATADDIRVIQTYQANLTGKKAVTQSLLDEINSNLNYTVMAMSVWVPLGILAGYYLYKKNSVVSQTV